jgi:hypothetical protein
VARAWRARSEKDRLRFMVLSSDGDRKAAAVRKRTRRHVPI